MNEGQDRFGLYQEFAKNRETSRFRRVAPFAASFAASTAIFLGLEAAGGFDIEGVNEIVSKHPTEWGTLLSSLSVVMGVSGIGAGIEYLDITRTESQNGKIAQRIAQLEGRNPQTHREKIREIRNAKRVVNAAGRVGPTQGTLFDLDIRHRLAKFKSKKNPAAAEEAAIQDREARKWAVFVAKTAEDGLPQTSEIITDALILADRQWTEVVENPKQSEYRRRYGRLMKDEIRRAIGEHLDTSVLDNLGNTRHENLTPEQLRLQLKLLVLEFPEDFSAGGERLHQGFKDSVERFGSPDSEEFDPTALGDAIDRHFQESEEFYSNLPKVREQRAESAQKKRLFERLRRLFSQLPTTQGYGEVLIRELGFQYDSGIEKDNNGIPRLSEPLLSTIGIGPDMEAEFNMFDPGYAQQAERRLHTYLKDKRKSSFNSERFDYSYVKNPVKRWFNRRVDDGFMIVGKVLSLADIEPAMERTWRYQYKGKYKEELKPISSVK